MNCAIKWLLPILAMFAGAEVAVAADPPRLPNKSKDGPEATLSLHAAVESIVPGEPFDLAIRFALKDGWHVYWRNPGDSGAPPRAEWQLPSGFSVGELQHPVPKLHHDPGDIVTNIHEGEPVFLVRVTPPAEISDSTVKIAVNVHYLVCEARCLPQHADLTIDLPVLPAGGTAKPANESLFAAARRALPKTESKYVTVTPKLSTESLTKGSTFEYVASVAIKPGHHIQSNKPLSPQFVATTLFVDGPSSIIWTRPAFPEAKTRTLPGLGKLAEFGGTIEIKVPGEAIEPVPGQQPIVGVLTYQACTDKGMCFPPESVSFTMTTPGEAPPATAMSTQPEPSGAAGGVAPAPSSAPAYVEGGGTCEWPVEVIEAAGTSGRGAASASIWLTLLFAALGGLILNIMPCVLPVISIKILSFVKQSQEDPRRVLYLGLMFAAGIVVSFEVLAVVALVLQQLGQAAGWGSQFQSPAFVIVMATVMFVFGLSLLGVFEIILPGSATTKLAAAEQREGALGAFFKGVLATVLATPCTAPFLGTAMGAAFSSNSRWLLVGIFTAAGVGMALPYIVLAMYPKWMRFLPKPGPWMEHFKEFMGFLLMGTFVWLMVILGDLLGGAGVAYTLCFLTFVGAACWLFGKSSPLLPLARRATIWTGTAAIVLAGYFTSFHWLFRVEDAQAERARQQEYVVHWARSHPEAIVELPYDDSIPWMPWWECRARELAQQGYTVYIDYTATWCATCQANKNLTLETEAVRQRMKELKVIPVKADYTNSDPAMYAEIQRFGRPGVPTNVIIPACRPDTAILLPENLVGETELVLDYLEQAGNSNPDACEAVAMAEALPRPTDPS